MQILMMGACPQRETHIDGFDRVVVNVGCELIHAENDIKPHFLTDEGRIVPMEKIDVLIDSQEAKGDKDQRFVIMETYLLRSLDGKDRGVYVTDCRAFIMNDKGKTTRSL